MVAVDPALVVHADVPSNSPGTPPAEIPGAAAAAAVRDIRAAVVVESK